MKKSADLENTEEDEDEEFPIGFASKKFKDPQKRLSSGEAEAVCRLRRLLLNVFLDKSGW